MTVRDLHQHLEKHLDKYGETELKVLLLDHRGNGLDYVPVGDIVEPLGYNTKELHLKVKTNKAKA
jgi:hypothetical protein